MARRGWSGRIRCSRSTYENSSPGRLSDPRIAPLDQYPNRENHASATDATHFFNSLLGARYGCGAGVSSFGGNSRFQLRDQHGFVGMSNSARVRKQRNSRS
jgi:hypothetical protein